MRAIRSEYPKLAILHNLYLPVWPALSQYRLAVILSTLILKVDNFCKTIITRARNYDYELLPNPPVALHTSMGHFSKEPLFWYDWNPVANCEILFDGCFNSCHYSLGLCQKRFKHNFSNYRLLLYTSWSYLMKWQEHVMTLQKAPMYSWEYRF